MALSAVALIAAASSVAASMEHGMEAPIRCARIHFSRTPSLDPLLPCVA